MTWPEEAARKLAGYFVADARLSAFVPAWIVAVWLCARLVPHVPAGIPALLLACGPIAALWWSVRQAARDIVQAGRARRENLSAHGDPP